MRLKPNQSRLPFKKDIFFPMLKNLQEKSTKHPKFVKARTIQLRNNDILTKFMQTYAYKTLILDSMRPFE